MEQLDLGQLETNAYGEHYYPSVNHLAFAKSSSEDVFSPYYQRYLEEEEAVYIIVGTDSGLLKSYLETKRKHTFSHFVFIELSDVVDALNFEIDSYESIAEEEKKTWLFNEEFKFGQLNRAFGHYVIRRKIHLVKSLAVMDAEQGSPYAKLWEQCEVGFSHFMRSEINSQSAKVFEEQRILNLSHNLIPAIELDNKLAGRDALILGGGPTLDDSMEWIRDNQDKFIIFAAARIAKLMEKEGILVDFFVTVDPFPWSFDNSKSLLTHSDYSILVHSFHAQHRLISQWNGLSCYLGQRFGWFEEEDKRNFDAPGPTVTNTALHIATTLGAKRCFLSGTDFCFAKGKTHESSSEEAKHKDTVAHHGKAMLEDNAGNMTETGDDFYSAKLAMENMIKYYLVQKPELEFISLGLQSAKMENVTYQDCYEITLDKEAKGDVVEEIKIDLTLTPEEKSVLLEQSLTNLKKQNKRFKKLKEQSSDGLKVSDKVYDSQDEIVEKQAKKVSKLQKKVNNLIGQDGNFLTSYKATLFSDAFKPIEDEQAMTNDQVVDQLKAYFNGINAVSDAMLALTKQGLDRLQLSVDELSEKIPPSKLFDRWQQWGEFGRAIQWQTLHDTEILASSEKTILNKAIAEFQTEFKKTDHEYQKRLEKKVNNASRILARANNAFAKGNLKEINSIIEHVSETLTQNDKQKQDFLALLKGMGQELEGNKVDAFNCYEPITVKFLRHIALKKMLPIAMELEDFQAAMTVLERMVQINLDYMVPYADMLKLLGNIEGAIEVLSMYLKQNPSKLSIKNRLAQFYLENGQTVEAETVLKEVLATDEANQTALSLIELCQTTKQ